MIAGFDVGGTNARGLLVDPATHEVVGRTRASSAGDGPTLVATLTGLLRDLESGAGREATTVGLGVAGLAHRSGVVRYSPNLPDIVEYPLGTELSRAVGLPVSVMNDATAGAWAEAKLGGGRGADDFAYVAAILLGIGQMSSILAGQTLISQEARPEIAGSVIGVFSMPS